MRRTKSFIWVVPVSLCLVLVALVSRPAGAAWPTDPLVNVPLCTAADDQYNGAIVADGAGGAIVVWQDNRLGTANTDIYAQRVLANGMTDPTWPVNGRAVCTAAYFQGGPPTVTSDGAGGAFVAWYDRRSDVYSDIYAQHVLSDGTVDLAWPANGLVVCAAAGNQASPQIIADDAGAAIVTWQDYRAGSADIYAQHVLVDGSVDAAWPADGCALCTAANTQGPPRIVTDGAGGAIVSWEDFRGGSYYDIYAQHVLPAGVVDPAWPTNGIAVCTAANNQSSPRIVGDGAGGAIVTWQDYRSGSNYDIYAERVLAGGIVDPAWSTNGAALCMAVNQQSVPRIVADGAGGAIVAWHDYRSGTNYDIYASRVLTNGTVDPAWPANGRALCAATGGQYDPEIVGGGESGAIVAWQDGRAGTADIYAQRVLADGTVDPAWPGDGRALCTAANSQLNVLAVADPYGGALVAWEDWRNDGEYSDIYAQAVKENGELGNLAGIAPGDALPGIALDPVRPNPTVGNSLTVNFALTGTAAASLQLFDVAGRCITTRDVSSLGPGQHTLNLDEGFHLAPGLYLVRLRQGATTRATRVTVLR